MLVFSHKLRSHMALQGVPAMQVHARGHALPMKMHINISTAVSLH